MIVWVRELKRRRLTRVKLKLEPKFEIKKMDEQDRNEGALNEIFSPPHSTLPSCFNLPALGANVSLKLKPHYIPMPSKFTRLKDAYLFLREFEEVCNMIHFHNLY